MYKFIFKRQRFACNVPLKDKTFVAVDVSNGQYQTDNKEVHEYLLKRSKETDSDIISLNDVSELVEHSSSQPKVVAGGRSSKNSEG